MLQRGTLGQEQAGHPKACHPDEQETGQSQVYTVFCNNHSLCNGMNSVLTTALCEGLGGHSMIEYLPNRHMIQLQHQKKIQIHREPLFLSSLQLDVTKSKHLRGKDEPSPALKHSPADPERSVQAPKPHLWVMWQPRHAIQLLLAEGQNNCARQRMPKKKPGPD